MPKKKLLCSKITGKLLCNFIEIALRPRCSPVNLLHIFRISFYKNTSGGPLLLCLVNLRNQSVTANITKNVDIYLQTPIKAFCNKKTVGFFFRAVLKHVTKNYDNR